MLEKIAKWLTRKPKLVAMMAVLMLIPAAIGYISTRINYDILSYLPEDLESSHGEKLLEEPFKMAATSMLVVESMPAGYTNSLLNDIKAIDGVSNAIWISNLMGIQIPTDMIPANFRDMFFAGDATMMIIQYSHPGASDETMEAIEQVRRACNEKCFLAGFSVVIKDTRDLMDSELPIVKDGEKVTVTLISTQSDSYPSKPEDIWLWEYMRRAMNIDLQVEHVLQSAQEERLNLMMVSGDLPDILIGFGLDTTKLIRYGSVEKQLLNIAPLLHALHILRFQQAGIILPLFKRVIGWLDPLLKTDFVCGSGASAEQTVQGNAEGFRHIDEL